MAVVGEECGDAAANFNVSPAFGAVALHHYAGVFVAAVDKDGGAAGFVVGDAEVSGGDYVAVAVVAVLGAVAF